MTKAESSAVRRERNIAAGDCINENAQGTHGKATHGRRCEACAIVNRCRLVIDRRRHLGFEPPALPPRVRAISPVIAPGLPMPRASFFIDVKRAA